MPTSSPFPFRPARPSRYGRLLAVAGWALAIAGGFRVLIDYELKAGETAVAPRQWPEGTELPFDAARMNLVMFAHPQCPCSRASMAELAVIMTRCPQEVRATVYFFDPESKPDTWAHSALWRSAEAIPGVKAIADRNGRVAARFGSATSGQVFLFDRNGQRVFSGGITGARGHAGENTGRSLVIALARGEACSGHTSAVFGCSLHDPAPAVERSGP